MGGDVLSELDGIDGKVESVFNEITKKIKENQKEVYNDNDYDDCFDEYLLNSVSEGAKNYKKVPFFECDSCRKKQVIIDQYNKVCNREYIPPYVDKDCRDFKLSLVIQRIDDKIIERVFNYLLFRTSIKEILCQIDDPEWKKEARSLLIASGYNNFIRSNFGKFNKNQIIDLLFDINYCFFDEDYKRNLDKDECIDMVKYYIVLTVRDKIKESLFKIAKLIELELEYKIAVIEGEIRYIIRCILQEIVVTPLPTTNYNITHFNEIGSLTELLKIFNGFEGGKHDERSDFKEIRDTITRYEKVVRTTFDLLNDKIKEYGRLIDQRKFIVGVTGICERPNVYPVYDYGGQSIVVPPVPIVILNSPSNSRETDSDPSNSDGSSSV